MHEYIHAHVPLWVKGITFLYILYYIYTCDVSRTSVGEGHNFSLYIILYIYTCDVSRTSVREDDNLL